MNKGVQRARLRKKAEFGYCNKTREAGCRRCCANDSRDGDTIRINNVNEPEPRESSFITRDGPYNQLGPSLPW